MYERRVDVGGGGGVKGGAEGRWKFYPPGDIEYRVIRDSVRANLANRWKNNTLAPLPTMGGGNDEDDVANFCTRVLQILTVNVKHVGGPTSQERTDGYRVSFCEDEDEEEEEE
ncbi:hypothetical protein M0804_012073 [Polistes exclamans]|nr:hypothetical protein M0804_012073 [Polistes exclamans]